MTKSEYHSNIILDYPLGDGVHIQIGRLFDGKFYLDFIGVDGNKLLGDPPEGLEIEDLLAFRDQLTEYLSLVASPTLKLKGKKK